MRLSADEDELRKLAHDLRTPLTVVEGFARMLERGEGKLSPEDRAEFLSRILEAAGQMGEIIDGITRPRALASGRGFGGVVHRREVRAGAERAVEAPTSARLPRGSSRAGRTSRAGRRGCR